MKSKKRPLGIVGIAIILCGIIVAVVIASKSDSTDKKLSKQLNLGNSYMDELNYEEAIAAYEEAIKIDSKNKEAYIGLANAYIATGEYAKAVEILEEGYAQTDSADIQSKKEEVEQILETIEGALEVSYDEIDSSEASLEDVILTQEETVEGQKNEEVVEIENSGFNEANDTGRTEIIEGMDGTYAINEYDTVDNCIKKIFYNADNSINYYILYEYDEAGSCIKATYYDTDGIILAYIIIEYDGFGNRVKETYYNKDGIIDHIKEYDENGDWINTVIRTERKDFTDGGYGIFEYDENDNCIKFTNYKSDGTINYYIIGEYDEHSNCTKETYFNADGTISRYNIYEYVDGIKSRTITYNADGTISDVYEY